MHRSNLSNTPFRKLSQKKNNAQADSLTVKPLEHLEQILLVDDDSMDLLIHSALPSSTGRYNSHVVTFL